ncbi:hypothetical protein MNBD_NITROSPINAE02-375 [hydrothermal vent metagenome]|uniref:Cytochrome b/b6 N-terminal region profile domain-containing protein n=1 Tax=hydrothermal vent metagenome TaxID=652676 RepID=A0A3B1CTN8_9ZZZZ
MNTQGRSGDYFSFQLNPLNFLGGITFLLFWILLSTGSYLYLFYEMTPSGAYESVQNITIGQKYFGGIIRSIHRYSADGILIVIVIHIFMQFFSGRFRNHGRVAWTIGAMILPVMWLEGVLGYFLVWDQAGQMIAETAAYLLDALLIHHGPMARNFLLDETKNGLLFFIFNYAHLGIPALLLLLAWAHCMRISMPPIAPPRQVTIAILFALFALAIFLPATSLAPADLASRAVSPPIDWIFLAPFRLVRDFGLSPLIVWVGGGALYFVFFSLPWIFRNNQK